MSIYISTPDFIVCIYVYDVYTHYKWIICTPHFLKYSRKKVLMATGSNLAVAVKFDSLTFASNALAIENTKLIHNLQICMYVYICIDRHLSHTHM